MLNRIAFTLMAAALTFGTVAAQEVPSPLQTNADEGLFLIITDIHFDPFVDPSLVPKLDRSPVSQWASIMGQGPDQKFQGYGNDAGFPLMRSAIHAAAALNYQYDYVYYTGDYLSHGFGKNYQKYAGASPQGIDSFAVKTTQFVSSLIKEAVGDIPVFGVLGNTDAACGDYQIAPSGNYVGGLADQWAELSQQPDRFPQFDTGGFYKVGHPTMADHDVIVLNNIFWTPRYSDSCNSEGGEPGDAMMSWLDWQLYETRQAGKKVQILMHVPPGVNAYSTARNTGVCAAKISLFWKEDYTSEFINLMRKYAGTVNYTFSGHTHMDSFAIIEAADGTPLVASQITPAVSPIFGNNPAFAVFQYNRQNGELKNSATYYLENLPDTESGRPAQWKAEYTYQDTYSVQNLTAKSRSAVAQQIKNDDKLRSRFIDLYAVSTKGSNPITSDNWQAFTCAQSAVGKADFQKCYCKGN
ncbi:MAG: metallophosphoesterase [Roseibium sp.]